MSFPFEGYEVDVGLRPKSSAYDFDLDRVLSSIVALEARVPADATTATALGTERIGNGVVIGQGGLVLTIGYLLIEASEVTLITNDGRRAPAHVLGTDPVSGLGLVHALEPLELPALPLGDSRRLGPNDPLISAGGGGRAHAAAGRILARQPFAGYWEYLLEEALFVGPAHPHWSGAALIGPEGDLVGVGSLAMQAGGSDEEATPINMFVPIELLPPILDDLSRGRVAQAPRPWIGVFAQDLDPGVVIIDVSKGGPSARAEVRAGDRILAVNGTPVSRLADFYRALWASGEAGVSLTLRLRRQHDDFDVAIRSIDRASTFKKPRFN